MFRVISPLAPTPVATSSSNGNGNGNADSDTDSKAKVPPWVALLTRALVPWTYYDPSDDIDVGDDYLDQVDDRVEDGDGEDKERERLQLWKGDWEFAVGVSSAALCHIPNHYPCASSSHHVRCSR